MQDDHEGEIGLSDDDPEVVRLLVEYFYLLDYEPLVPMPPPKDDGRSSHSGGSRSGDSDTMSVRTEAGTYGHVYGTSAVSAFGGPRDPGSPFSAVFRHGRDRSDSSLTVHAMPAHDISSFGGVAGTRRRKSGTRDAMSGMRSSAPESSPLATPEPHLTLHARIYSAAHKYGIAGLSALALDKFKIQLTRHWDSSEFAEAIHVVYNSTPSSDKDMREAVADTLGWHGRLLDKPEIEVAVMEINGLAYELLKRSRRAELQDFD